MTAMILRLIVVVCGGSLACVVVGAVVLYAAWIMSRRDNGWDR